MKKLAVLSILIFTMVFMASMVFAADATASNGYLDDFYKGAVALVFTALAALITAFVPTIATKGNQASDAFFDYLKSKTKSIHISSKKEENERVAGRLDQFIGILDSAADSVFTVAGKVKVVKTPDGKVKVENLDELKDEIHENVLPRLTSSTKALVKETGLEVKDVIESLIKEKASKLM